MAEQGFKPRSPEFLSVALSTKPLGRKGEPTNIGLNVFLWLQQCPQVSPRKSQILIFYNVLEALKIWICVCVLSHTSQDLTLLYTHHWNSEEHVSVACSFSLPSMFIAVALKILLMIRKVLYSLCPGYLKEYISRYKLSQLLRSSWEATLRLLNALPWKTRLVCTIFDVCFWNIHLVHILVHF